MEKKIKECKSKFNKIIQDLTAFIDKMEEFNYTNEQWFLDGMDAVNIQSVRH